MATINIVNGPGIWEVMQAYFNYSEKSGAVRIQTRHIELEISLHETELKKLSVNQRPKSLGRLKRTVEISIEGLERHQEGSRIFHDLSGRLYLQEEDLELFSLLGGQRLAKGHCLNYTVASYDLHRRCGVLRIEQGQMSTPHNHLRVVR
jgi:hypothetical protein